MSTAADHHLTSHDIIRVGFTGLIFNSMSEDGKQWPPHIARQLRDARICELQAKEERLKGPMAFMPRSLSKEEAAELQTLLAEQKADPTPPPAAPAP